MIDRAALEQVRQLGALGSRTAGRRCCTCKAVHYTAREPENRSTIGFHT